MVTLNQTMISAIASIGNFIITHQTTPASVEFNLLIHKIANTLQTACDSLDHTQFKKKLTEETAEDAQEKLLGKYQLLSNKRDENISQGHTELDTETLHALQEAYLISNHMGWLKSLSENLEKTTERYRHSIIDKQS
jgi:hypothetical protein